MIPFLSNVQSREMSRDGLVAAKAEERSECDAKKYGFCFFFLKLIFKASLVAQMVKCLPAMRETQVQSLGWEDLLEKEAATHSRTLAWRIPRAEEPGRLQSMGSQRVGHD